MTFELNWCEMSGICGGQFWQLRTPTIIMHIYLRFVTTNFNFVNKVLTIRNFQKTMTLLRLYAQQLFVIKLSFEITSI